MKVKAIVACLALICCSSAGAKNLVEIGREQDKTALYIVSVDQDTLKLKNGMVFFWAKAESTQAQTAPGGAKYDYQFGEFAVNCRDMSMAGLTTFFYLKNGTKVGTVSLDEEIAFRDKFIFSEMGGTNTLWAKKIIYACNWLKSKS
jgi:hypothetical protein